MQQLTNLQELEMAVNLNGEVVVTKNNKNNVILMSMEEYKKSLIKDKIKNNLIKAEEDIKLGRVRDAEEVLRSGMLNMEYNYVLLYTVNKKRNTVYIVHFYYGGRNYLEGLI